MAMKEWTSKRLPTKPNMGTNMHKEMETDKHLNADDSLRNFANAREPIVSSHSWLGVYFLLLSGWSGGAPLIFAAQGQRCVAQWGSASVLLSTNSFRHSWVMDAACLFEDFFLEFCPQNWPNIDAFDVYISGRSTDNFMGHVGCQDLVNTVIYSTIVKGFTMSRQHEQAVQPRSCEAGETPWNFHEFYMIFPRKLAW